MCMGQSPHALLEHDHMGNVVLSMQMFADDGQADHIECGSNCMGCLLTACFSYTVDAVLTFSPVGCHPVHLEVKERSTCFS